MLYIKTLQINTNTNNIIIIKIIKSIPYNVTKYLIDAIILIKLLHFIFIFINFIFDILLPYKC